MTRVLTGMFWLAAIMAGPVHAADAPAPGQGVLMQSMDKMNKAMAAAPMTGNPDHDFAAMMVPHHQGAIDMAIYELDHGTDPKMRKLAASIVKAQENEIALMQKWLAAQPKPAGAQTPVSPPSP